MTGRILRVLLVDDHVVVREGLKTLINSETDMEVVGEATDGREVRDLAAQLRPDVVVMDVSMPHLNGIEATRKLKEAFPAMKVLALSGYEDRIYIRRMMEAGATGYVLKRSASGELLRALRLVASGALYLDSEAARRVEGYMSTPAAKASRTPDLTPRETEVLRLIAWGFSNKEIAARLGITVKTVETHRARSMEKLDLQSRAAIVRLAIDQGWLRDPA
jgi:DNA-binding NarL/FixJ family response regulator